MGGELELEGNEEEMREGEYDELEQQEEEVSMIEKSILEELAKKSKLRTVANRHSALRGRLRHSRQRTSIKLTHCHIFSFFIHTMHKLWGFGVLGPGIDGVAVDGR